MYLVYLLVHKIWWIFQTYWFTERGAVSKQTRKPKAKQPSPKANQLSAMKTNSPNLEVNLIGERKR